MNASHSLLAATCLLSSGLAAASSDMITLSGGSTTIGSAKGQADEQPVHTVKLAPFELDRSPVTVAAFAHFVAQSGYRSTAEKLGSGAVMHFGTGRWSLLEGANWRQPQGPQQPAAPQDHPVTQVSWEDAKAYCHWSGKRLPTEYEWEHAARSGHSDEIRYAFGDELVKEGEYLANIWTGMFPLINTAADGYKITAPVGQLGISPLGLTDMAGNVWEWVDADYLPYPHRQPEDRQASEKVQRGGSYLCDPKICHGFRVSARSHATPDSSLMHVGFRCARDRPGF